MKNNVKEIIFKNLATQEMDEDKNYMLTDLAEYADRTNLKVEYLNRFMGFDDDTLAKVCIYKDDEEIYKVFGKNTDSDRDFLQGFASLLLYYKHYEEVKDAFNEVLADAKELPVCCFRCSLAEDVISDYLENTAMGVTCYVYHGTNIVDSVVTALNNRVEDLEIDEYDYGCNGTVWTAIITSGLHDILEEFYGDDMREIAGECLKEYGITG